MKKFFWYTLSVFCSALGLFFIFLYLNLLVIGYTFLDYVYFIIRRVECYFLVLGILIFIGLVIKERKRL